MSADDRYTRQRRLREVGSEGQERIERARLRVRGGPAACVELAYLHRAGVGTVELDALDEPRRFAHAAAFRHAAARRHAAAAWRAARSLLEVLGRGAEPS